MASGKVCCLLLTVYTHGNIRSSLKGCLSWRTSRDLPASSGAASVHSGMDWLQHPMFTRHSSESATHAPQGPQNACPESRVS